MTEHSEVLRIAERTGRWLEGRLRQLAERADWDGVAAAMDEALRRLAATECWGEANRLPSGVFWREAEHQLRQGSLQTHARLKPHQYAGDFEMLERIVARDCRGEGLGLAMDRYFQDQAAPKAVRNRTAWAAERIAEQASHAERPFHVVSIGSGPAADLRAAARSLPARQRRLLRLTLLDLDAKALQLARTRLVELLDESQVVTRRENLFRLPRSSADSFESADVVLCSGLFDYLADEKAVELLRWMNEVGRAQGQLVAMNFSDGNRSRAYMEWIGNWYLLHRTEDDLARLAAEAGINGARVHLEPARAVLILTNR